MYNITDPLSWLLQGNSTQQNAYHSLVTYRVIEMLKDFTPTLAGTVPLAIDIPGSDLDILCYFSGAALFRTKLEAAFSHYPGFTVRSTVFQQRDTVIAQFKAGNWPVEVFGQDIPVTSQWGYRHMLAEAHLLKIHGETLREQVIALKQQGYKTEPAFAHALGWKGDPYIEMLQWCP